MPKRNYSIDLQLKVARANRILSSARQRVSEEARGSNKRMERSLDFAEKELSFIYGEGATKFKLSGMSDNQIELIERSVDRVLATKTLTLKGMREADRNALMGFFRKPYEEISSEEKDVFNMLIDSGIMEKVREVEFEDSDQIARAIMSAPEQRPEDIVEAIRSWVNNVGGVREQAENTGTVSFKLYDPDKNEFFEEKRKVGSIYDYVSQRYSVFTKYNQDRDKAKIY